MTAGYLHKMEELKITAGTFGAVEVLEEGSAIKLLCAPGMQLSVTGEALWLCNSVMHMGDIVQHWCYKLILEMFALLYLSYYCISPNHNDIILKIFFADTNDIYFNKRNLIMCCTKQTLALPAGKQLLED